MSASVQDRRRDCATVTVLRASGGTARLSLLSLPEAGEAFMQLYSLPEAGEAFMQLHSLPEAGKKC